MDEHFIVNKIALNIGDDSDLKLQQESCDRLLRNKNTRNKYLSLNALDCLDLMFACFSTLYYTSVVPHTVT